MHRLARYAVALIALALLPGIARADSQDIAAAARSVVRVALVATKGDEAYFVGHGSGIVIAPDKVLTNAHVVELTRQESDIVIGVIPAEGSKSYGARVVAYSPGNDLALLQVDGARLTPATFFASATQDGQEVVAIGYPGSVDRAQGMSLADIVQPMSAVKTSGTISAGRSSKQYDTILHTAPIAAGSSGGALVDTCGRVLGVNSFESLSDGTDATYGFAVSGREIAAFLRQARVQPLRTVAPCRSLAETEAADLAASARDKAAADARLEAEAEAARVRTQTAHDEAMQTVFAARENHLALAALLLAGAVLAAGWAALSRHQGRAAMAKGSAIGGGLLLVGALLAFFLRPGFDTVEDRAADIAGRMAAKAGSGADAPVSMSGGLVGENICRLDMSRSRVTVTDTADLPFRWSESGCVGGDTQFVSSGSDWHRIELASGQATASDRSFDPATATLRVNSYALDANTAETMRQIRAKLKMARCSTDPEVLDSIARSDADLRAQLPAQPNERLVYHCAPGKAGNGAVDDE